MIALHHLKLHVSPGDEGAQRPTTRSGSQQARRAAAEDVLYSGSLSPRLEGRAYAETRREAAVPCFERQRLPRVVARERGRCGVSV